MPLFESIKRRIRAGRTKDEVAGNERFVDKFLPSRRSDGAESEERYDSLANMYGSMGLHDAASAGNTAMVERLLNHGTDIEATDACGQTALQLSVSEGLTATTRLLLEHGAAIDAKDQYGRTVLHEAAANGRTDDVLLLLIHGADIDAKSKSGDTALRLAVEIMHYDTVSLLLDRGADINATTNSAHTVLHYAAQHCQAETVRLLLERGADIEAKTNSGDSALCLAAWEGNTDSVRLLLQHGAATDATDSSGTTALHWAAQRGHTKTAQILLDYGANIDARHAKHGDTALHAAAGSGRSDTVRLLLDHGANIHAKDNYEQSCLRWAIHSISAAYPSYDTTRVLCEAGAVWDEDCNVAINRVSQGDPTVVAGVRACARHWTRQHTLGPAIALTDVPIENVKKGKESVETYLSQLGKTPANAIVRRRKVCVIGASCSGKTSLVKSLQELKTVMVEVEDRTIGIDLFTLDWNQGTSAVATGRYEATIWDFGGQDLYRVAHSLYFSKRTLYLVFVNVETYIEQLRLGDRGEKENEATMSRWVRDNVFCWVQLVLGRQPDAEVVIVCSKCDRVDPSTADVIVKDLEHRLSVWATDFANEHDGPVKQEIEKTVLELTSRETLRVSIATQDGGQKALEDVRSVVTEYPGRAYLMPRLFTQVLEIVYEIQREAAATTSIGARVKKLLVQVDELAEELMAEIDGLTRRQCRDILGTFHALGDILWFEQERHFAAADSSTIVLDPKLLLDLVREVVNHELGDRVGVEYDALRSHGELKHSLLSTLPLWNTLCSESHELTLYFKQLLQHFNLAYPVGKQAMAWDSDLIVPSYWKTDKLPLSMEDAAAVDTFSHEAVWQYTVLANISEPIFDQFIVQSHDASYDRVVTSAGVTLSKPEVCRASIRYNEGRKASEDVILIRVKAHSTDECWRVLGCLVASMERVLDGYPGLGTVHRHVLKNTGKKYGEYDVKRLLKSDVCDTATMVKKVQAMLCRPSVGA